MFAKNCVNVLTILMFSWLVKARYPPSTLAAYNSALYRYRTATRRPPIPTTAMPTAMRTRNNIELPTTPTAAIPTDELRYYGHFRPSVQSSYTPQQDVPPHYRHNYGHRWMKYIAPLSFSPNGEKKLNHDQYKNPTSLWKPIAYYPKFESQSQTNADKDNDKVNENSGGSDGSGGNNKNRGSNMGYAFHQIPAGTLKTTKPYESPTFNIYSAETESY